MNNLTDEESLALVNAIGDAAVSTREALSESQAALGEALKYVQPLAEQNGALQGQVDALQAANQKFVEADAKLDAAISAQRDRVLGAPQPPAEPETPSDPPAAPVETPVTDDASDAAAPDSGEADEPAAVGPAVG